MFAKHFTELGLDTWWDRKIPPGKTFDEVITYQLEKSKCVVVLWSKHSIGSRWVKEEAAEASARNVLIPVMIDEVKIPMGFRRIEAAQLIDWKGDEHHPEYIQLVASIQEMLEMPISPPVNNSVSTSSSPVKKSKLTKTILAVVALVAVSFLFLEFFPDTADDTDFTQVSRILNKGSATSATANLVVNSMTADKFVSVNNATYLGENQGKKRWEWTLYLDADDEVLDQVRCVEYVLHPTFPNPFQQVCHRANGFAYTATGWGTFKVEITVILKNGRQIILPDHQLEF